MKYYCKNVLLGLLGLSIFLSILVVVLHSILICWTNWKYKDINVIIVKEITTSFDSQCFEIIATSKQKRFFKLTLKKDASGQKVLLPVSSPKYSFFDDTWRTHIFIRAFANGNISIVHNSTEKPDEFFSISTYPQHDIEWYINSNGTKFRRIPAGKEAICTILTAKPHYDYYLEFTMADDVLITH
jgi:hypothetical protein